MIRLNGYTWLWTILIIEWIRGDRLFLWLMLLTRRRWWRISINLLILFPIWFRNILLGKILFYILLLIKLLLRCLLIIFWYVILFVIICLIFQNKSLFFLYDILLLVIIWMIIFNWMTNILFFSLSTSLFS